MITVRNLGVGIATLVAATLSLLPMTVFADEAATTPGPELVERGRYLVLTSGCHDCHTPLKMGENGPEPDFSRMLSGHPESVVVASPAASAGEPWMMTAAKTLTAFTGPWGVSFTANLTPDEETGLGRWTFQNFKDTIRSGRHLGRGREVLPPMPIPMYRNFNDADLAAIYSFLRSIPPVKNRVPEPLPPPVAVAAQ